MGYLSTQSVLVSPNRVLVISGNIVNVQHYVTDAETTVKYRATPEQPKGTNT